MKYNIPKQNLNSNINIKHISGKDINYKIIIPRNGIKYGSDNLNIDFYKNSIQVNLKHDLRSTSHIDYCFKMFEFMKKIKNIHTDIPKIYGLHSTAKELSESGAGVYNIIKYFV